MKKKIVSIMLVAGMMASLAACGSNGTSSDADTGADTSATDETTADAASGDAVSLDVIISQYGTNTQEWWSQFEQDFEAENPDIDLNIDIVSWNDIYTVVNTRVSTGEAPDILNIDVFADYVADDLLMPVDDYISEETLSKIYPSFLEQSVVDGVTYAVPILASARAMYYNKDILEAAGVEVPTTWDELKDACAKLKEYDSNIYPWGIDMTTDEGQAAFAYYTWNNGGGFVDADGNWALNSAENAEAIQFAVDLVNAGYTNTDPANETRYNLQDMFGAGQVAMMIGPNNIPTYLSDGGFEVNYGVASIPSNTGDSINMGVMDRLMAFDNDDSEEKIEAITKFFDFFYDDERYADYMVFEGFLPATSTGAETLAAQDETYADWIDILSSCQFYPASLTEWADVKQGVIKAEQSALLGDDIQTALDDLQTEITGE
jgi:multiple sugar transport system substrate-binding protein